MKLIRNLDDLPEALRRGAVAIGNFDGVHRGHAQIVNRLLSTARELGGAAIVFTFDPHPARLLRPEQARSEEAVQAFRDEARSTAAVDHEAVVKVHECGVENGVHYLVMEFVDGPPLDRLLRERGRLKWKIAVRVALPIART